MIGIYVIKKENIPIYVGQSKGVFRRWAIHEKIYPTPTYSYEVLESCKIDELIEREKFWISKLDTYYNGANKTGRKKRVVIRRENYVKAHRDNGRINWLLNSMKGHACPCGESELVCLEWHPHHKKITAFVLRHGAKTEERKQAQQLILKSEVVCHNCVSKIDNGLASFII